MSIGSLAKPPTTFVSNAPCGDGGQPRPVVKQCAAPASLASEEGSRPLLRHLRDKDDNEVPGIKAGFQKGGKKKRSTYVY